MTDQPAATDPHRPPCIDGDHCGELHCPPPTPRRRLTEAEHDRAWHAVEGAAGEEGADPGTVLNAVLRALRIDPPEVDEMAASLRRDGFGDDEITEILRHDDALCGHCGVPKASHHHPWTSTADTIADAPQNAEAPTP